MCAIGIGRLFQDGGVEMPVMPIDEFTDRAARAPSGFACLGRFGLHKKTYDLASDVRHAFSCGKVRA
jgi:hypothetical protein